MGKSGHASSRVRNFSVEKILNKRFNNGTVEYHLKWRNFPICDSTWEPIHHLHSSCFDLIKSFEKSLAEKQILEQSYYVPIKVFKSLYNVEAMSQFYAGFQQKYPEIFEVHTIENINDPVLPYLQAKKILGVNQSCPNLFFVVEFAHRDKPIYVLPEIVYNEWPDLASDFYNEWISAQYSFDLKVQTESSQT